MSDNATDVALKLKTAVGTLSKSSFSRCVKFIPENFQD